MWLMLQSNPPLFHIVVDHLCVCFVLVANNLAASEAPDRDNHREEDNQKEANSAMWVEPEAHPVQICA